MSNQLTISGDIYTDRQIDSGSLHAVQSIDGDELQYDTFTATLDFGSATPPSLLVDKNGATLETSDGLTLYCLPDASTPAVASYTPGTYRYGSEVYVRHNDALLGKFYLTKLSRVGRDKYKIDCVSAVGMLANAQHYGGLYFGEKAENVITSVIGGVVAFSVSPEIKNVPLYGWLPFATRRENLHQVLFALGAAASKDRDGNLFIAPITAETYQRIPDSRIYMDGTIEYPDEVKKVTVSEHAWKETATDETVTLFQGEVAGSTVISPQTGESMTGSIILFDAPAHSLQAENGTILESGVNYAVLAPSPDCTLTGKNYSHSVRQITNATAARIGQFEEKENELIVSDAWLSSVVNSENIVQRLSSYYSSAKTIKTDIVVDTERPGTAVELTDPFGDVARGIIKSMDMTLSGTVKAGTEIIADYIPVNPGNFYQNVTVIKESGSFTVPAGVTKIRVVLIGGGQGGGGGYAGRKGHDRFSGEGETGDGGLPGAPGSGGRIYIATIDVTPGQSCKVTIGQGGEGGEGGFWNKDEVLPRAGYEGGATTFSRPSGPSLTISSASGNPSASGYTEIINGGVYGITGEAGARGGHGSTRSEEGERVVDSTNYTSYPGEYGRGLNSADFGMAYGGAGGGAAIRSDGNPGGNASWNGQSEIVGVIGGNGGKGADAGVDPQKGTARRNAQGGTGGNGGGGGGEAGRVESPSMYNLGGQSGNGGAGSVGGIGGPGVAIIYY